jgi:hypothetical protein
MCGVHVPACVLAGWVSGLTRGDEKPGPVEYVMGVLAVYPQGIFDFLQLGHHAPHFWGAI